MRLAPLALLALGACATATDGNTDDSDVVGANTVVLSFAVSDGVRNSAQLVDPLLGAVHGSLFNQGDVGVTGPHDGVDSVADVSVDAVDLTTDTVSAQTWTSGVLPAGAYLFLGMYDVDGNYATTGENPDPGDPVTLATTNVIAIVDGEPATATATFQLIYN